MNSLQTVSKALAGAFSAALVAYLAKHHVILGSDVSGAVTVLIAAVVGFVVTYLSPKNKE